VSAVYLQQFSSYSNHNCKKSSFLRTQAFIFCLPWGRPCGNHAKRCMNEKNSVLAKPLTACTHLSWTVSQLFEPQVQKIAVFTYRSPHFCFSWRRPCNYHATCCMDGKTIQCLSNPSQHIPIYLQQFSSYSNRKCKKSQFSRIAAHIFVSPGDGDTPAIITQYVAWMERQFNTCQTPRRMYPSVSNSFPVIRTASAKKSQFSRTAAHIFVSPGDGDTPSIITQYVAWMERQFNACQTPHKMYPSVFNSFPVIRTASAKKSQFSRTAAHICVSPGDAPAIIMQYVAWMERQFNACQTPRSMYPSVFNSFPVIQTASAKTCRFHVPQPTFLFPLETPLRLSPNMFHGWNIINRDAPGAITLNVVWMEREFDAYKLSRCMCPSNYNRFWDTARYWSKIVNFFIPPCIRRPHYGGSRRNSATPFGMEKLEWLGYPMVNKLWSYLYSFWRNSRTWRTDRWMDTGWRQ